MGYKGEKKGFFSDADPSWMKDWQGMPEYQDAEEDSWRSVIVHFKCLEDREAFSKLVGQKMTNMTKYIWYPKAAILKVANKRYVNKKRRVLPKYPIYVISKGRWESRLTSKALEEMEVPYHIVVEPQEYDKYAEVIDPSKIYELPFSNLGQGSIPARNWVWEHSLANGDERHWILDDNISGFMRRNNNIKIPAVTGSVFRAAEDFVDRYENVAMAGFQYDYFAPNKKKLLPFALNTRIYSCILLKNSITHRWRGRYNEDTDLSLRILKDGWCTILFYAFLACKIPTMTMKGGNMEELYKGDGRLKMAESLRDQHPDVTKVVTKWGRYQHQVDYKPFIKKNRLVLKKDAKIPKGTDDYGMSLEILEE